MARWAARARLRRDGQLRHEPRLGRGGLRELDTAAGQLAAVRRIIACESDEEVLRLIADPGFQQDFANEYAAKGAINGGNALEAQTIVTVGQAAELQSYLGRTLGEVAQAEGRNVVGVLLDLGLRSRLALQLKSPQITSADPRRAVRMMATAPSSPAIPTAALTPKRSTWRTTQRTS